MTTDLATQISSLKDGDHLCLFYDRDPAEQLPALVPFIQEALCKNERFIYIADDQTVEQLNEQLRESGIAVAAETARGRLKLWTRQEWRQRGELSSDSKAAQVRQFIQDAFCAGFKGIRFAVEMTWTLGPDISAKQLEHWEATINTLFTPAFPGRIICQYNRSRLSPAVMLAALHTHPLAILGSDVCPNLFYEAPLILRAKAGVEGNEDEATLRARVDWMVGQLKRAHAAERERIELAEKHAALADAETHRRCMEETEAKLRRRTAELTSFVETAAIGLHWVGAHGRILWANQADMQLLGYAADEYIGRHIAEFHQDAAVVEDILKRLHRGEKLHGYEARLRCKDGSIKTVLIDSSVLWEDGNFIHTQCITRDITEGKQVEEQLRASEERIRQLVALMPVAVYTCDAEGKITFFNRKAVELWGREPALGTPDEKFCGAFRLWRLDGTPMPHAETPMAAAVRSGCSTRNGEVVIERPEGTRVVVSVNIDPLFDSTGQQTGAINVFQDITQRKQMELQQQALYELVATVNRSANLSQVFEAALDVICRCQNTSRASVLLFDTTGVMRFRAWRGLSDGYRRAVEGHSPWKAEDPDPQPVLIGDIETVELEAHLKDVIRREGIRALAFIPIQCERRLLGKFMIYYGEPHRFSRDEFRPAETIATQLAFAIERHMSGEALERTVRERTASLREAVAQMEEFSYTVSHDLRAPLRGMQVYTSALIEEFGDTLPPDARHYLMRVEENAARLDKMILDVLTFSRVARAELRLEPVNVDRLVRQMVEHYPGMQPPQALIEIERLQTVLGHEPSLTQAISNLLNNAIKFVRPGATPRVRIWSEPEGGRVRLCFQDNGIGIDPKYQHRLFNIFERVHADLKYDGTGIGLAIVRKAIERMGGKVGVESDGSHGSRFWIELNAPQECRGVNREAERVVRP